MKTCTNAYIYRFFELQTITNKEVFKNGVFSCLNCRSNKVLNQFSYKRGKNTNLRTINIKQKSIVMGFFYFLHRVNKFYYNFLNVSRKQKNKLTEFAKFLNLTNSRMSRKHFQCYHVPMQLHQRNEQMARKKQEILHHPPQHPCPKNFPISIDDHLPLRTEFSKSKNQSCKFHSMLFSMKIYCTFIKFNYQ